MKKESRKYLLFALTVFFICLGFASCKTHQSSEGDDNADKVSAKSLVQVTNISIAPLKDVVELSANSSFLKKNVVKSNANAYIQEVMVNIGDYVEKDAPLYTLKTKEAAALHPLKDTTLNFSGLIKIKSPVSGILVSLDKHPGDYVQDGDQLCAIAAQSSLVFLLDVPFELHGVIKPGMACDIILPDSQIIKGKINAGLPSVDQASQTQSYIVQPSTALKLPENLVARIRVVRSSKSKAATLPKSAVLTDETQSAFWVMKLINDSIAVKILIKKGIETRDAVEILSPGFSTQDRIITTGNYGLGDSARIQITKPGGE